MPGTFDALSSKAGLKFGQGFQHDLDPHDAARLTVSQKLGISPIDLPPPPRAVPIPGIPNPIP